MTHPSWVQGSDVHARVLVHFSMRRPRFRPPHRLGTSLLRVPGPCPDAVCPHRGTAVLPADVPSLSLSVSPAGTIYPLWYVSGISIGNVANRTCTGAVSATASPIDVRPASSPRCTHLAAATTTHHHHHHSHSRIQRTYVMTDKKTKTKHKL